MIVSAAIRKNSHIHRSWVRSGFVSKEFFGARFVKQKTGDYVADNLGQANLDKLQHHACVQLTIVTEPQGIAASVTDEVELQIPLDQPKPRPRPFGRSAASK